MMRPVTSARGWRRVFAGLYAFPTLLASAALRIAGQHRRADALVAWIGREWLGLPSEHPMPAPWWRQLGAIGMSLAALAVTLYLLAGIVLNLGYPLRPSNESTDWGGPSLWGRWAVHGAGGVMFVVATPFISRGLAALTRRILAGAR
ncbi:MAG: hypothetical protein H7066_05100 [Cytophagaceae bacterium]|nr:hypothetical protein [Gemmatimonadaceae bacterium]